MLKVPLQPMGASFCPVAASLCVSPSFDELVVPSANAIFFNGDRVEGTGNPVIERLSDLQNLASVVASKFGDSVNAWVIEASTFNGPFAVYQEFIPSVNNRGEPQYYKPDEFPASRSVVAVLTNFLEQLGKDIVPKDHEMSTSPWPSKIPSTFMVGFSKGGTVLNQLVTEYAFLDVKFIGDQSSPSPVNSIIPSSSKSLLDSIREIHYVDVGLNSPGAYLTDKMVIKQMSRRMINISDVGRMRVMLHGTPRQWCDKRRDWIRQEKEEFARLLEFEAQNSEVKLKVSEKMYFAGMSPDLQMHFQIIEALDVS